MSVLELVDAGQDGLDCGGGVVVGRLLCAASLFLLRFNRLQLHTRAVEQLDALCAALFFDPRAVDRAVAQQLSERFDQRRGAHAFLEPELQHRASV